MNNINIDPNVEYFPSFSCILWQKGESVDLVENYVTVYVFFSSDIQIHRTISTLIFILRFL